jgi:VWFA-related protein
MVAPWSKVSVAGLFPNDATAFNEGIDKIVGQRFEDRSSFPISDAEAIAAANGDPQTIARLANRYVALNPTLTFEAATALVHQRAVEVAQDVRQRRDVLYGIAGLALEWLAKQPGRHSLLVVSPGFPREPGDPRYQRVVTRSMQVNAPIHFVDVRGLHGMGLQGLQYRAGMDENANTAPYTWNDDAEGASLLADETGGMTVRNTNDIGKALASVVDTMSTYYVIGYEAPAHAKGGFKKISVEAKTRGLRVRARKGYYVVP